jgi:hypothetical protein
VRDLQPREARFAGPRVHRLQVTHGSRALIAACAAVRRILPRAMSYLVRPNSARLD